MINYTKKTQVKNLTKDAGYWSDPPFSKFLGKILRKESASLRALLLADFMKGKSKIRPWKVITGIEQSL